MVIHHQKTKFDLVAKIVTVFSLMSLMLKNASCILSVIIVALEYSVGLSDDLGGAISMGILTSFALCCMFVTIKTKLGIMWFSYKIEVKNLELPEHKKVTGSTGLYSMMLIESTNELIIPILTDLPRAILQLEAIIFRETYSPTIISSVVLLVFSIGGALKMGAISALICECLEFKHIPIIGHFTARMKLLCAFNPCFTNTQLLRKVLSQLLGPGEENSGAQFATFSEVDSALVHHGMQRLSIKQKSL
jgi:hypothetical protein